MSGRVALTIDGRSVTVDAGASVLEAARALGIEIPTLCHVEGIEPAASCFLCCVQVRGHPRLSPACALPAAEGMVVATDGEDIRATRRMALELLLSDHAGDCIAPCSAGCPAGLDVAAHVYEIAGGHLDRAVEVLYDRLSLPGALGRICPRLCEQSCRRCDYDHEGLAIAALHRYAADRNLAAPDPWLPERGRPSGKTVAIVGAGPAGLSAAFYLQRSGHDCTILDAHAEPGGMLRYAIPEYRLPRKALGDEVRVIESLGARFRMGLRLGEDFHLTGLRHEFDAVFIAIGAQLAPGLRCDGEELAVPALRLLGDVARGCQPALGRRVIVVGGGNTAMDAARTAVRLGAEVRVLYRRTREEMPCLLEEVEHAEDEGVTIRFLAAPVRIGRANGTLEVVGRRMEPGEPDDGGRRRPRPIPGSEFGLTCDTVIAAIGQAVDRDLARHEGLALDRHGIRVDPRTLATGVPGVFAGGDAVLGPDLAVRAVAAGRIAAVSIDQYLSGAPVTGPRELTAIALRPVDDDERAALFRRIEQAARVRTPTIDTSARLGSFAEVDLGLEDEPARLEALRCLSCDCRKAGGCTLRVRSTEYGADPYRFLGERRRFARDDTHPSIVLEPGKCIACEACVRIAEAAGARPGLSIAGRGFGVTVSIPFDRPLAAALDEETARACAQACPTGAIALRTARACDLPSCGGGCPLLSPR